MSQVFNLNQQNIFHSCLNVGNVRCESIIAGCHRHSSKYYSLNINLSKYPFSPSYNTFFLETFGHLEQVSIVQTYLGNTYIYAKTEKVSF